MNVCNVHSKFIREHTSVSALCRSSAGSVGRRASPALRRELVRRRRSLVYCATSDGRDLRHQLSFSFLATCTWATAGC